MCGKDVSLYNTMQGNLQSHMYLAVTIQKNYHNELLYKQA